MVCHWSHKATDLSGGSLQLKLGRDYSWREKTGGSEEEREEKTLPCWGCWWGTELAEWPPTFENNLNHRSHTSDGGWLGMFGWHEVHTDVDGYVSL